MANKNRLMSYGFSGLDYLSNDGIYIFILSLNISYKMLSIWYGYIYIKYKLNIKFYRKGITSKINIVNNMYTIFICKYNKPKLLIST